MNFGFKNAENCQFFNFRKNKSRASSYFKISTKPNKEPILSLCEVKFRFNSITLVVWYLQMNANLRWIGRQNGRKNQKIRIKSKFQNREPQNLSFWFIFKVYERSRAHICPLRIYSIFRGALICLISSIFSWFWSI